MEYVIIILQLVVYYFHYVVVLVVLPLLVFLAIRAVRSYRKSSRLAGGFWGVCILVLIGLSIAALHYQPLVGYRAKRFWQPGALAAAIDAYHSLNQSLPHSLEKLQATGLYGQDPYLEPLPWYRPVQDWDGKTAFILAVEARTKHTADERAYIVAGRRDARWADDKTLAELLAKDDVLRRSHNQLHLWESVPWRERISRAHP